MKDSSVTSTLRGVLSKDSDVVECVGSVDEANTFIGLAKVFSGDSETKTILEEIQRTMFKVGAEVSSGKPYLSQKDYERILELITDMERKVELPASFVVLETNETSAMLSVARTVVRRAERRAVKLYNEKKLRMEVVEWLNKLSYLLYLLALKAGGGQR
ncbi:MAG: cob(I)yrinic acid a,c-diamide adenosyltransferase [Archaeoglobales archaeon]|nr:MAG: cob(I)yrinic acid a,c-diamide adenosyltransferase [Archaeoglobales archaeon]